MTSKRLANGDVVKRTWAVGTETWVQIRVQLFINYVILGKFLKTEFNFSACDAKSPQSSAEVHTYGKNVMAHFRNSLCVFVHTGTPTLCQVLWS